MSAKGYRDLEIYRLAHQFAVECHKMTLKELPAFELYEEGSQLRRASKSVAVNIVEGFALRRYKNDFVRYLTYAHASCDETREHLQLLFETQSLSNEALFKRFMLHYEELSRMINGFIRSVELRHKVRGRLVSA